MSKKALLGTSSGGRCDGEKTIIFFPYAEEGYVVVEICQHNYTVFVGHFLKKPDVAETKEVEMENFLVEEILCQISLFLPTPKELSRQLIEFAKTNQ